MTFVYVSLLWVFFRAADFSDSILIIQKIFVDHIRFGLKHRTQGIMEKKAVYAAGEKNE